MDKMFSRPNPLFERSQPDVGCADSDKARRLDETDKARSVLALAEAHGAKAVAVNQALHVLGPVFISLITSLSDIIADWNEHQGFWEGDDASVTYRASKIALMHSELGEMLEGLRKSLRDEHISEFSSEVVELADTIIRALDYAGRYQLPLAEALLAKLSYNTSRPFKHGKAI